MLLALRNTLPAYECGHNKGTHRYSEHNAAIAINSHCLHDLVETMTRARARRGVSVV